MLEGKQQQEKEHQSQARELQQSDNQKEEMKRTSKVTAQPTFSSVHACIDSSIHMTTMHPSATNCSAQWTREIETFYSVKW